MEDTDAPTAHLVHGFVASGKSSFAADLARRSGSLLLSEDDWYLRLFTDGSPTDHLDPEAHQRLVGVLDGHWPQLLRRGVSVVLDFGFWARERRDLARTLAQNAGGRARLYSVKTDESEALARLAVRNREPRCCFLIDAAAYEHLKAKFEPLEPDEDHDVIVSSNAWRSEGP